MHYNRKDIIQAWILALEEHHNGQNEYSRLKRLQEKYPQYKGINTITLTQNGYTIYKKVSNDLRLNRSYF